ncbi:hypothetical protein ACJBU6_02459 [Exserohilum turcicum]
MHGTGKATLAMMASVTCQRRVIDMESVFHTATGFSTTAYRKQFGSSNRSICQEDILRGVLQNHSKGAIIVCNGSFPLDNKTQSLLREFSTSHPVIHITRDTRSVCEYLEIDEARVQELVAISTPVFRRCSNYEFYNISETNASHLSVAPAQQRSVPAFLTLKRAERTFFKFLARILSPRGTHGSTESNRPTLDPGYFPLSYVHLELRNYTCAVQVQLSDLIPEDVDIEELEFGCDAFEIVVEPKQLCADYAEDISKSISRVRRSTVTPIIYHVMPTSTKSIYSTTSYLASLWHGLRMAPEFITVDLTMDEEVIQAIVASRASTKVIGHLHAAMDWYDVFWLEKYDTAMRLGCSVARFTRPANFMDDNAAIQSFRNTIYAKSRRIPMICYNTGKAGRRSACFNQVLTPVIPEKLRKNKNFEERAQENPETSWLTVTEATHILYASFTYDPMEFYVIGAATGYSLSPAMHNAAYRACGMPHHFDRIETSQLDDSIKQLLRQPNFGGTAVSQPFKVDALALTHAIAASPEAATLFPSFVQDTQPTFCILPSRDTPWPAVFRPATIIVSCIPTHSVNGEPSPDFTLPLHWMQSPSGGVVRGEASSLWICLDGLDLLPEQGFAQFELFTGKRAPRRIMREEVLRCWTDERGRSNLGMVRSRLEALNEQES